jgi:hypothetical protein
MSEALIKYFENQAGTGISGFQGVRFQKGHNIFARAFKFLVPKLIPALKFLGKHALQSGISAATDIIQDKKPVKESIISRGKEGLKTAGMDGLELIRQMQLGKGRKRKRTSKAVKPAKKRKQSFGKKTSKVSKRKNFKRARRGKKKSQNYIDRIFKDV